MTNIPDSLLAVDIETASPHKTPGRDDYEDTSYFELVAVGLGYQPDPSAEVETNVLFRQDGWNGEATKELLQRLDVWCGEREADAVLTHNGKGFDETHLRGWAREVAEEGLWPEAEERMSEIFTNHIDLNPISVDRHQDSLEDWRDYIALEDVCEREGIEVVKTYYDEYELGELIEHEAIDSPYVENTHIGSILGEAYVLRQSRGSTDTKQFQELERLLKEYTKADIEPLFQMARRFSK